MYQGSIMDWQPEEKKQEISEKWIRHIVVNAEDDEKGGQRNVGFLSWRCDMENEELVLYIYELFIEKEWRRRGIAKELVSFAERIAGKTGMFSNNNAV